MKIKPVSIFVLGVLAVAAVYFLFMYEMPRVVELVLESSATPIPSAIIDKSINFDKTGNFTRTSPEYNRKEFYIIYEEPGAPALSARLYFNEKSICVIGGVAAACDESVIETGARIRVFGIKQQNYVIVRQLFTL